MRAFARRAGGAVRSASIALAALAALVALVAGAGGCSDIVQSASPFDEKQARCELRPATPQCTDIRKFKGPSLITFQNVCATLEAAQSGTTGYTEGSVCDAAEMWGGCQSENGDGSLQTNWFYKSDKFKTEEDAKKECDENTTWVGPS